METSGARPLFSPHDGASPDLLLLEQLLARGARSAGGLPVGVRTELAGALLALERFLAIVHGQRPEQAPRRFERAAGEPGVDREVREQAAT